MDSTASSSSLSILHAHLLSSLTHCKPWQCGTILQPQLSMLQESIYKSMPDQLLAIHNTQLQSDGWHTQICTDLMLYIGDYLGFHDIMKENKLRLNRHWHTLWLNRITNACLKNVSFSGPINKRNCCCRSLVPIVVPGKWCAFRYVWIIIAIWKMWWFRS